jgi:hypothetical protein
VESSHLDGSRADALIAPSLVHEDKLVSPKL